MSISAWQETSQPAGDTVEVSPEAREVADAQAAAVEALEVSPDETEETDPLAEMEFDLVKQLVEVLLGRRIALRRPSELIAEGAPRQGVRRGPPRPPSTEGPERAGWGLAIDASYSLSETESTRFEAAAVVETADGRSIDVSLQLAMSRAYAESANVQIRAGDALKDPLVLQFNGTAAELTERTFSFDLDVDGVMDDVPELGAGGAMLVDDRDGDGRATDGSELFGPTSGDGFAELARHDSDGNGWIDEADPTWSRLNVWAPTEEGGGRLVALADAGVGAIFTGGVDSEFALKGEGNETRGMVRETGIWIGEDGSVGAVQRLDLAV